MLNNAKFDMPFLDNNPFIENSPVRGHSNETYAEDFWTGIILSLKLKTDKAMFLTYVPFFVVLGKNIEGLRQRGRSSKLIFC